MSEIDASDVISAYELCMSVNDNDMHIVIIMYSLCNMVIMTAYSNGTYIAQAACERNTAMLNVILFILKC